MYNIKRHYTFISSFSDPYKQPILPINYTIDVKTNGVQDVTKFAEAINKLKISEKGAEAAITQVKNMVNKMDAIFKPKGRKRDVNYNVNVKTDLAEEKLDKVLRLVKDIQAEAARLSKHKPKPY